MPDPEVIRENLIATGRFLSLSTLGKDGAPQSSYVPTAFLPGMGFPVLVSELAAHTGSLLAGSPCEGLLLGHSGGQADAPADLFQRARVILQLLPGEIPRSDPDWDVATNHLRRALGDTVSLLITLSDFHLVRLKPVGGTLIAGFGAAYALEGESLRLGRRAMP